MITVTYYCYSYEFKHQWLIAHLPVTIKFTRECDYDMRPRDHISIACEPKFHIKGDITNIDFANAHLTLETNI
jgi:hypothetical protein